ncbi:MAG: tetratricopeptide repeat protein [Bacteroidota bacterium]
MTYIYQRTVVISIVIITLLFSCQIGLSIPTVDVVNSDSLKVYQLIDSANVESISNNEAIQLSKKSIKIAAESDCESCVAASEFSLGIIFFNNSVIDSAIQYFNKALLNFNKTKSSTHVIEVLDYISKSYNRKNDFEESINYAQLGLIFADSFGLVSKKANFNLLIGISYLDLGLPKKSVEYLMNALSISELNNDSSSMSRALTNLGLIAAYNDNYEDALKFTNRALIINKNIGDKEGVSICLNNIGYYYSLIYEYEEALYYFQQSLELNKELKNPEGIATCLNNIGDSYKDLHDTILAVSYYTKSLNLGRLNNYSVVITALINLGEINLSWGNFNVALKYALEGVEIAQSKNSVEDILLSYNLLYRCYAARGNYEKAYKYSELYKKIYDSTFSIAKSKNIQEVISSYNDEQQKTEIVSLKEKSSDDFIFRAHLIQTIIAISFILIVLFITIIFIRRAKNRFRSQKQYYEKLLERSEDFIFVVGKDGLTRYMSPSYQRKIGRINENRIGKDSFEFIHPEDVGRVKQEFANLATDAQPRTIEFRIKDVNNNWIDVFAYGQNLFDDVLIQGIVVNFWDITQRKKNEKLIEKNENKFRQIFIAFPDIYFQANLHGIITEISPSVKKITGYTRDEIIGMNSKEFRNFIGDWRRIEAKFRLDSFVNDFDTKIIKKDGDSLFCSLSAEQTFSDDGEPIGIKGVIRDITNRIASQQKLRDSQTKLKEANKSKEMLFSIISHDLIGPIGTNKSIVDMIVDQIDEFTHDEIVSLITSLKPSLDSTFSLIENLLSWSRIQQDRLKPNFEDLSLNKVISELVLLLKGQAQLKQISLKFIDNKPVTVVADKNQLDVALRNLVSNAIKFSHQNSEIIISLDVEDNMAVVKIKDSGIGMNERQLNDVIAEGGSTSVIRGTNNEKGTGFGLIIVNEFIKNNNGKLNATSKVNVGTTFVVTLPLKT